MPGTLAGMAPPVEGVVRHLDADGAGIRPTWSQGDADAHHGAEEIVVAVLESIGWEPHHVADRLAKSLEGSDEAEAERIDGVEIASLYLRRWEEETAFDEIKTHLGDAATVNRPLILRSRRPQRVEQEIYGLLIAYNALRRLMVDAADASEEQDPVCPLRLSFIAALERLREAVRDMMRLPPYRLQDRYADLLRAVARVRVPLRPGRSCPRAVRIKMSNYPLNRRRHAG